MNKETFKNFAAIISETYPKDNILASPTQFEIWYELLADIPDELAMKALKDWVVREKWPPHISDIREYAAKAILGEVPDWGKAWETVIKAVGSYGSYNEPEAMASLDEITRECVKNLGFRSICLAEEDRIDFIKSQFKDLYNRKVERQLRNIQTPSHLQIGTEGQQLIGG